MVIKWKSGIRPLGGMEKECQMNSRRYSRQRELIYEALKGSDQHPTAEMLYHQLKPENPSLSLGTIYRNLNLLTEEGRITRMPFPVERYDADIRPHSHFRCDRCGSVFDLALPYDTGLDERALQISEHQIAGHQMFFHGVCAHCKQVH